MAEVGHLFSVEEFQGRIARLQGEMKAHEIDALLLTTPADVFYTTGFLTRFWESPARPWFVIVPATGDPVAVIPTIGEAPMARTWIKDIRTWDAPDPNDSGMGLLGETLRGIVPSKGRIGLPMGLETHLRMPLADFQYLQSSLEPCEFVDGTACVQRVREIKSEPEISKIRTICGIAARAFADVPQFARPGETLDGVFRTFQIACLQHGADWVSYLAGAVGKAGYGDVISPAKPQPLNAGDVLMLDTGAVRDGYFCDFDRNFSIGQPSDEVLRTHDALWQATEEALSAIRPGMRACDVHQMLCHSLNRLGAQPSGGRLGHGLGLSLTEWPSISAMDETPLRSGMVLTVEPGAVLGRGRMLVHEENFVLRDDGAELLSERAPQKLPVIT